MKRMPWLKLALIPVVLLLSCATTGPGGKQSLVLIPTGQEVAIGAQMAQQVEATEKRLQDSTWQVYLTEIGNRIVRICDRQDIEYHFTVIESDVVNAFAAPGGYIYFYTGLLREMDSEAELAAVMAHEISHVVARHGIKRLQKALGVALAYELVLGGNSSETIEAAVGVGMGLLFAGYSREAEREADNFGLYYMIKAGYDPNGMLDMFATLTELGGGGSTNLFERLARSHPETEERIANTRTQLMLQQPLAPSLVMSRDKYQTMLRRLPAKQP